MQNCCGMKKYIAEFIGTFVLTLVGCGVATVVGCATAGGLVATAFAFGLSVVAMAYAIGGISGCHINPAISLGMLLSKRMSLKDFLWYVLFQTMGAIAAACVLWLILINIKNMEPSLGTNAVSELLTGGYTSGNHYVGGLFLGLLVEIILTFIFVFAAIGATDKINNPAIGGIVIGLTLTLVHLLGIRLTGTSVNPARSIGPALLALAYGHTEPIREIWIFIFGPFIGAALAAAAYKGLTSVCKKNPAAK
jgi:aquaporin Z